MPKFRLIAVGIISGMILTIGLLWIGTFNKALAQPGKPLAASTPVLPSGAGNTFGLSFQSPEATRYPRKTSPLRFNRLALSQHPFLGKPWFTSLHPTAMPPARSYFCLIPNSVVHTVALRGYSYNGVLGYSLNVAVPAASLVRLSSNSIAAAPPPSWATPAPIITNFTDFTYYASLSLPKGVKAEGYILFNPGTGTSQIRASTREPSPFASAPIQRPCSCRQ